MIEFDLQLPKFHHFGYSCQTLLACRVNEFLHSGTYWCWFSEEFNPDEGGNSSNPCWRYRTFDKAVKANDFNDAYVQDAREKLTNALNFALAQDYKLLDPPNSEANVALAKNIQKVRQAGMAFFRPQIWRIDLTKMGGRFSSGHQYAHEHHIEDLKCGEFETIIE